MLSGEMNDMSEPFLLEMRGIHKSFPGVKALDGVSLDLRPGEVHALLGENGAGKSTLIKILGGIYSMDQGEIAVEGKPVTIHSVVDARACGVSIIHQELVLVPGMTVAENIFLGREPRNRLGLADRGLMAARSRQILEDFGLSLDPMTEVGDLTIAQQQMVEVVKAVSFQSRIIVMDEPTSSLSDNEVEALFRCVRRLTAQGIGIIYISHRMSELSEIADRVTVLRDGQCVGTRMVAETTNDELIAMMVGRAMDNYYTRTFNDCTEPVLEVEGLTSDRVHDVSFQLRRGEILGFAGLVGAGRSETVQALFGLEKTRGGRVRLEGKDITGKSAASIIAAGVGLVPEDRKGEGFFPNKDIRFNISLKVLREFIHGVFVNGGRERELSAEYMKALNVKAPGDRYMVSSLSGGNQQKVVIAGWLAAKPKVLILDEPTRGIDVGAKSEIYVIMNELAKQGVSIIMISSELPEIINMSDRVVVMRDGTVSGILDRSEATQEKIMQYAVTI